MRVVCTLVAVMLLDAQEPIIISLHHFERLCSTIDWILFKWLKKKEPNTYQSFSVIYLFISAKINSIIRYLHKVILKL